MKKYIDIIIKLAQKAANKKEVPVGAIVVCDDKVVSKAYNKREKKHDVLGHAEILAIKKATRRKKSWKLTDCDLYVTLKPCSMCESVIRQARIRNVYYLLDKPDHKKEFYKTNVCKLREANNYEAVLKKFFSEQRKKK